MWRFVTFVSASVTMAAYRGPTARARMGGPSEGIVTLYFLIVFVHVAAAVALLSGSVIASPAVRSAVRRARSTQEIRAYLSIGRPLLALEPISAMVVLASGIYLASVGHFWTLGWVQVAAGLWVVNAAVAGALVKPVLTRLAAEVATATDERPGKDLAELRRSPRWTVGGDLLMANDAAVLYLMTMRPGLVGSLGVVIAVNLGVAAARRLGRGDRRHTAVESVEVESIA